MWVPSKVFDFLMKGAEASNDLKAEFEKVKRENELLFKELTVAKVNLDWFRIQVNQLQNERAALLQKSYGITTPAPQIASKEWLNEIVRRQEFSFEDMGDDFAKKEGLPVYNFGQHSLGSE